MAGIPADSTRFRQRLSAVSSLRVPCAVFVFLHHIEGHFGVPSSAFPFRKIVVSLFLVLSGFLLYSIYGDEKKLQGKKEFYLKRIGRIYPLHIVNMLLIVGLFWSQQTAEMKSDLGMTFFSHIALIQCWFPEKNFVLAFNGVTWTLSVILFCYLIFPFLVRAGNWLIAVFLGLLFMDILLIYGLCAWSKLDEQQLFTTVQFFPFFRMLEFIAGMLAAQTSRVRLPESWSRRRFLLSVVDLFVLVGLMIVWFKCKDFVSGSIRIIDDELLRRTLLRWFSAVGFAAPSVAILIWFAISNGFIAGGLRSNLMVFLGNISYAFYLCHRPIILKTEQLLSPYPMSSTASVVICFGVIFVVSTTLYFVIEKPIRYFQTVTRRKLKDNPHTQVRRSMRIDNLCGVGILTVGILMFLVFQTHWPQRHVIEFENGATLRINRISRSREWTSIGFAYQVAPAIEAKLCIQLFDGNGVKLKEIPVMHLGAKTNGIRRTYVNLQETPDATRVGICCRNLEGERQSIHPQKSIKSRLRSRNRCYLVYDSDHDEPDNRVFIPKHIKEGTSRNSAGKRNKSFREQPSRKMPRNEKK